MKGSIVIYVHCTRCKTTEEVQIDNWLVKAFDISGRVIRQLCRTCAGVKP